jgi:Fe-S-cluster-containing dehydrogenase component
MKAFIIDVERCNGCYSCQLACKDEHVGNDWSPYAKPQPEAGHFWMKMVEKERGTLPKVMVSYTPTLCMHCDMAPCIPACPVGAITKRSDGIVLIDPAKCNGCRACIAACPYGAIYFNDELNIAQKCTGCAHILDGTGGIPTEYPIDLPRCVDACPTEAIKFGDDADPTIQALIGQAEVIHPEWGTKPRVFYLNLPKPFLAGAVYDPVADACIEGATVTATDLATGDVFSAQTDEFGDFWLKGLQSNRTYDLSISASGYLSKKMVVFVKDDKNVGDITLFKEGM